MNVNWNYPTSVWTGAGRISELTDACRALGISRPLLVTDPGLSQLPLVLDAVEQCQANKLSCSVFSDIKANPSGENVEAGAKQYKETESDGVIAFGGGSR